MTIAQVLIAASVVMLVASALLALVRLAKGPTGMDRGVASDVLVAVITASICAYSMWARTSVALAVILVLSLLGFTSAVALARLITTAVVRARRFRADEAARDTSESEGL